MANQFERITYEKLDGVATITINRETSLNSMDALSSRELHDAFADFRDDDGLRVAILTGTGPKSFSTGMDLVATASGEDQLRSGTMPVGGFTKRLPIYKPIIAAINGFCLAGGLELALACDIRIATPNAKFGLPEVRWALIPGAGGTQRLPRAVGQAWANYMILTAEQIDAETALRIGLISHIVQPEELMAQATKIARSICDRGPLAVRLAKEAINRGLDMTLENGLALEDALEFRALASEDSLEGPRAFAEKRNPVYTGR